MPDTPDSGGSVDSLEPEGGDALRIAMIAPPWFTLPPQGYGGTEWVVSALVDALVEAGHHVELIGSGENGTQAQSFHRAYAEPPTTLLGTPLPEVIIAAEAARILERLQVDIVHDHTLAGPLLARGRREPTVVTMHGSVDGPYGDYHRRLGNTVQNVAISDSQRRIAPDMLWVGTVHNAVDVSHFPFRADKSDYALWLGRISPEKGPELAIIAAREAGIPVVLAGKLNEPEEHRHFEDVVQPLLGSDARFIGEVDTKAKHELLGGARALLFPIQWEEPFGMVMIEAMACGTPVVALRRGSVPEVVADGISGFIVDHVGDLPSALRRVSQLDPAAVRRHVERHFDVPLMRKGYEEVYRRVLHEPRGRP